MYCIGLISGTSVDGIDAALLQIAGSAAALDWKLLVGNTYPYPEGLRERLLAVGGGAALSVEALAELDDEVAIAFADAAARIQVGQPRADLIGSHGQTVFHRAPNSASSVKLGYSLQLGRGEAIASLSQIPTVSNFRAADIAACGQGAPLVPKVDAYLLGHSDRARCVQNLGGIGNVTYLPPRAIANWESQIRGWDTGPGNILIDLAVQQLSGGQRTFDRNGDWAAQGKPCQELVERWMQDPFFAEPPPKSTGRERFGLAYLQKCRQSSRDYVLSNADWLATLTEFTVVSVVDSYQRFLPAIPPEVLLCGGGGRNHYLKQRLEARLPSTVEVLTTDTLGLSSDYKEAIAFAILAYWRFACQFSGNLPSVTGATQPCILGDLHLPL